MDWKILKKYDSVEVAFTLDGADLTKSLTHVTEGLNWLILEKYLITGQFMFLNFFGGENEEAEMKKYRVEICMFLSKSVWIKIQMHFMTRNSQISLIFSDGLLQLVFLVGNRLNHQVLKKCHLLEKHSKKKEHSK